MPLSISPDITEEKNKLTSSSTEIILLEITYKTEPTIRLCLNNEEIVWPTSGGETWYPALFKLSGIEESKEGTLPKVSLGFYDVSRILIPILEETGGAIGASVTLRVVNSDFLSETIPMLEEEMEITTVVVAEDTLVDIELGALDLSNLRIPKQRYLKNNCRFQFKTPQVNVFLPNSYRVDVGDYLNLNGGSVVAKILDVSPSTIIIENPVSPTYGADFFLLTLAPVAGDLHGGEFSLYEDAGLSTLKKQDAGTIMIVFRSNDPVAISNGYWIRGVDSGDGGEIDGFTGEPTPSPTQGFFNIPGYDTNGVEGYHLYVNEAAYIAETPLFENAGYIDGLDQSYCQYSGVATECNRSYARCKELENQNRFGGFPGLGEGGLLK